MVTGTGSADNAVNISVELANVQNSAKTTTFTVIPTWKKDASTVTGPSSTVSVVVNPQVRMDKPANDTICHGAEMAAVNFTTAITDGSITYAWTRDNTTK